MPEVEEGLHKPDLADQPCRLTKIESLKEWFSKEFSPESGACRPCRLQPLASLYLAVLEKAGATEDAKSLSEAYDTKDILTIARTMDSIKERAREPVRKDLETLDCFAQEDNEDQE